MKIAQSPNDYKIVKPISAYSGYLFELSKKEEIKRNYDRASLGAFKNKINEKTYYLINLLKSKRKIAPTLF
jgi:hypothetical protein